MDKYMKHVRYAGILLMAFMGFSSCGDDFLEVIPKDQVAASTIFSNETSADLALYDVYKELPDMEGWGNEESYYSYDSFEHWSDNAVCKFDWAVTYRDLQTRSMTADQYNPGWYNHGYPALPFVYDKVFKFVRKANFFIENVALYKSNFSEEWIKTRVAEARFLRAVYYHEMWMAYGGLPIITRTLNLSEQGDNIFYPRSTFEQTGKFIIQELKEIANDLPDEISKGRATRAAALTLKAWCELFMNNYSDAAATCQQIIGGVHSLFTATGATSYNDQFMEENNNNCESIFAYQHDKKTKTGLRTKYFGPAGEFGAWGAMCPSQSLVDDYLMKDGLPKEDSPLWNPKKPYDNREPRFYQSVIYNGAEFAGKVYDQVNQKDLYDPSREYRSGYFRCKGINPDLTTADFEVNADGANFAYFRYAEVLLMYAEAKIEQNQIDDQVLKAINDVRVRAGIPTLQDTYGKTSFEQNELRDILRRERRIEFAFECKRYWDLIRWRTAEIVLTEPYYGMTVNAAGEYEPVFLKASAFHKDRSYLFPIYTPWIQINHRMLEQNDGVEFFDGQNPGY